MQLARNVAQMGMKRNAYSMLTGKSKGKRPLGKPRHGRADNIKMGLTEVELSGNNLAQDKVHWRDL
jgi:hypothetical protein